MRVYGQLCDRKRMRGFATKRPCRRRIPGCKWNSYKSARRGISHVVEPAGRVPALVRHSDCFVGRPICRRTCSATTRYCANRIAEVRPQEREQRLDIRAGSFSRTRRCRANGPAVVPNPAGSDARRIEPQNVPSLKQNLARYRRPAAALARRGADRRRGRVWDDLHAVSVIDPERVRAIGKPELREAAEAVRWDRAGMLLPGRQGEVLVGRRRGLRSGGIYGKLRADLRLAVQIVELRKWNAKEGSRNFSLL